MRKKTVFTLLAIVILALLLRTIGISKLPLYGDELTMVYDSYSILKTGKDQLGNIMPLTFEMGAGRPAGYVYASIPFVFLFGPTAWGVRSLSILSGVGITLLIYFLTRKLYNEKTALIATVLTAVSPWELSLSRGGFEAHFALFLALLGLVFLVYSDKKSWFYIPSFFSFALTLFTYPTYKVVIPLFILLYFIVFVNLKKIITSVNKRYLIGGLAIFATLLLLSYYQTFFNQSEKRFFNINIFADENLKQELIQEVNFERNISSLPIEINKYFLNRPLKYGRLLLKSYLENFSFDFLFISGDGNPRHNMTAMGYFYWVEVISIFFGFLSLYSRKRNAMVFFVGWMLISPLATTLILTPHGLRNSLMIPPFIFFSAIGVERFVGVMKHNKLLKLFGTTLIFIWCIEFLLILNNLYFLAPQKYSQYWSYSAKQAIDVINSSLDDYDFIFLSNRIDNAEYAFQVYNRINPGEVVGQQNFPNEINGIKFKNFGKIYIGTIPEDRYRVFFNGFDNKKVLYLANHDEIGSLENYQVYQTPDLLPGFIVR